MEILGDVKTDTRDQVFQKVKKGSPRKCPPFFFSLKHFDLPSSRCSEEMGKDFICRTSKGPPNSPPIYSEAPEGNNRNIQTRNRKNWYLNPISPLGLTIETRTN